MTNPYESEPPQDNLFAAPTSIDRPSAGSPGNAPGTLAIVVSVIIAILVSIPVFMVTFFFTCIGMSSIQALNNEAGIVVVTVIAGATSILSLILVTKGLLALVRAFKST